MGHAHGVFTVPTAVAAAAAAASAIISRDGIQGTIAHTLICLPTRFYAALSTAADNSTARNLISSTQMAQLCLCSMWYTNKYCNYTYSIIY